jgi:hypothetical protein
LEASPPAFASYYAEKIVYEVVLEGGSPQFFWKHGWIPLRWGAEMHYAKQPEHTILGGFGCSKTTHVGVSGFVFCATVPRFRFVCAAGFLSNARPMFAEIKNIIEETPAEKFIKRNRSNELRITESPYPSIRFQNGSEMVFLGADKDLQKVRSESGDWYVVEQSESHSDLGRVTLELGTRGRGRVRGRKRLGRMTFIANSGEAPELWRRFDAADEQPDIYLSINMSSYENAWLSEVDIEKLERACGGDEDNIDQYMRGLKPIGKFKDFPKEVVEKCEDQSLDRIMAESKLEGLDASERLAKGTGHVYWSLPPVDGRDYAVYGDPGTKNPPDRGAGTVIVLDETNFPKKPADVVHFDWVAGNGRIGPWLDHFEAAIMRYNAQGRSYYDATGDQKNIDELSFEDRGLIVKGISMSGVKYGMKLKLLRLMERGLIRWAKLIVPIRIQFSRYDETVDKATSRLPQDIVMTFFLAGNELSRRIVDSPKTTQKNALRDAVRGRGSYRKKRDPRIRTRR